MELTKKNFFIKVRNLAHKIADDNLTLLASSVSYYSALGLAPFLLILLSVATFLGQDMKAQIVKQVSVNFSPEVGKMFQMVFSNTSGGVNVGSISGIIGALVLLWTASLVYLQFRFAFDVIYGHHDPEAQKSVWEIIKERILAMVMVVGGALLLILTFAVAIVAEYIFGPGAEKPLMARMIIFAINLLVYQMIFTGIHYLTPTRRPKFTMALKIALMSSIFFLFGNFLLASYLKGVATNSVYGATGTLLVFLVWAYYSSFTIFLSAEVFLYFQKLGKIK